MRFKSYDLDVKAMTFSVLLSIKYDRYAVTVWSCSLLKRKGMSILVHEIDDVCGLNCVSICKDIERTVNNNHNITLPTLSW